MKIQGIVREVTPALFSNNTKSRYVQAVVEDLSGNIQIFIPDELIKTYSQKLTAGQHFDITMPNALVKSKPPYGLSVSIGKNAEIKRSEPLECKLSKIISARTST